MPKTTLFCVISSMKLQLPVDWSSFSVCVSEGLFESSSTFDSVPAAELVDSTDSASGVLFANLFRFC